MHAEHFIKISLMVKNLKNATAKKKFKYRLSERYTFA